MMGSIGFEKHEAKRKLRDTLKRFGVIKGNPLLEAIECASEMAYRNFGVPDSIIMSQKQFESFKGLNAQLKKDTPNKI